MSRVRVVNQSSGATLAEQAEVAGSFLARGIGLMGRRDWARGDGLVIRPCNSVHCFFMRLVIDVAYVDRRDQICGLAPRLKPWRIGPIVPRSHYVVELPEGTLARSDSKLGDRLVLESIGE